MNNDIIIKKSKIDKKGVFTARDFKKGEVVLKWHPKYLTKIVASKLPKKEKYYLEHIQKNKYILMQPPERYVNHSCEPNTYIKNLTDIALKNIKKGKEITSDYTRSSTFFGFTCRCGSKKCRKYIETLK